MYYVLELFIQTCSIFSANSQTFTKVENRYRVLTLLLNLLLSLYFLSFLPFHLPLWKPNSMASAMFGSEEMDNVFLFFSRLFLSWLLRREKFVARRSPARWSMMWMSTIQTDLFGVSAIIILHTIKRIGTSRIATQVQKIVDCKIFCLLLNYVFLVQTNYMYMLELGVFWSSLMSQALVQTRTRVVIILRLMSQQT